MKKSLFVFLSILMIGQFSYAQKPGKAKGKKHLTITKSANGKNLNEKDEILTNVFDMKAADKLLKEQEKADRKGFTHIRHQQFYNNIKVEGAMVTVHAKNGKITSITGNYRNVDGIDTKAKLNANKARGYALAHVNAREYVWEKSRAHKKPNGELVIIALPGEEEATKLAYKFDIYASYPLSRQDVYVCAHTGEVLMTNERIHTNCGHDHSHDHSGADKVLAFLSEAIANGSGATRYSGTQPITTDSYSGGYRLRDYSRGNGVLTWDATTATSVSGGIPSGSSDYTDNDNNWTAAEVDNADKDNAGLDAHFAAGATYDFFLSSFGRNSYNANGAAINSYVNTDIEAVYGYPAGYNDNAFWNGTAMVYGKGGTYDPLTTVDITAHEIGHAFCEYTANLVYQNESGAINESLSDIWGTCVEHYTNQNYGTNKDLWALGSEIGTTFRSMSNPNLRNDPDTYGGTYWYTGTGDNGGVHINSGVGNHWFYLLTVGKSGTNDLGNAYNVSGIGIDKAAAIVWRTEAFYLGTSSNYAAWRSFAIQAAEDLYGADSPEVIATTNSWYAVGVGSEYQPPIGCVDGNLTLSITLDNYPSETSWTVKDAGGTTVASGSGYSGSGSTVNETITLADGNYTFTINDSYGDGICCSYGQGSYTLSSGSTTIVSGGAFGSSETTDFCIDNGGSTADTQAPSTPTSLTASNTTETTTDLSWNASSDNVGVTGYYIFVNGSNIGSVTGTSANITGLTAGTTYTMAVAAFDAAGNVSGQASTSVTTDTAPTGDTQAPSTPTALTASNTTQTSTDLSWNASSDNVGVTAYDVYVDGVLDGSTASTSYSVSGLAASTTYTMAVRARDAAGNASSTSSISVTTEDAPSGGTDVLSASYFESGWDGWSDGGSDCYRYSGSRSYEGSYSIRIRDNSGAASAMTSGAYNLAAYNQVTVEFYFYSYSMENGEDFWLRYNDGSGWQTIAAWARGTNFNNNTFYTATVTLDAGTYNLTNGAQFRFQCDASGNQDHIYIDQVIISGINGAGFQAIEAPMVVTRALDTPVLGSGSAFMNSAVAIGEEAAEELSIYPNPTEEVLNINLPASATQLRVFAVNGALMRTQRVKQPGQIELNVAEFKAGTYFLSVQTAEGLLHKKFIKL